MIKLKNLIFEDVHGVKAIVYHRTKSIENFNKILSNGFTPGGGAMYGFGLYTTYTPTFKHSSNSFYGPIQIKFIVDVIDFFIFDYDIYIKSINHVRKVEEFTNEKSNKSNYIRLQANYFNIPMPSSIDSDRYTSYTSDIALAMGFDSHHQYYNRVNGIIFTGRHDGEVLVCYNTKLAVPVSYSDDNTGETTYLKDIKNLDSFIQRYQTASQEKVTLTTSAKTVNSLLSRYSFIKFNPKTRLFDVTENFTLTEDFIKDGKLRIKFGIANKNFRASKLSLTSLEGFPKYVGGSYSIYLLNNITTLKGGPEIVRETVSIRSCHELKNLEYGPRLAYSYRIDMCNKLESLNGIPKDYLNFFECLNCVNLKHVPFYPLCKNQVVDVYVYNTLDSEYKANAYKEKVKYFMKNNLQTYINHYDWKINGKTDKIDVNGSVGIQQDSVFMGKLLVEFNNVYGDFTLYNVSPDMVTLKNCPKYVKGEFDAVGCKHIKNLYGAPKIVDGGFSISLCANLVTLKGSPKKVGGSYTCVSCYKLQSLEGAPEEVGGAFDCSDCTSLKSLEYLPKAQYYYVPHHLKDELQRILTERGEKIV